MTSSDCRPRYTTAAASIGGEPGAALLIDDQQYAVDDQQRQRRESRLPAKHDQRADDDGCQNEINGHEE